MEKKWWHDKVAYQIYPKSFQDTDGDGIGDLRGVINRLDYLSGLGIDIIWLSPVYASPFADQGYDISDYYRLAPCFGTMADMDELIAETKKRGMYLVMDLVVNHCSDEHEWFKKAAADPTGEYGKYFYIEEGKDGKAPSNVRSYFGGSMWERIGNSNLYYLHMFHKKQPDLNWENPIVREKIYEMINWWLEKGIAGFRIDAIINIKKELPFHDYPPDREDGMAEPSAMLDEASGVMDFLNEMSEKTFKKYDAFTVGEVFNDKPEELTAFIGEDGCFSSIFNFSPTVFGQNKLGWFANKKIQPDDYKSCCFQSQKKVAEIGFYSNIIENHDGPRGVSRFLPEGECFDTSKKLLATLYFLQKGLPFIYQGQELGMENTDFPSMSVIDDISTRDQYQVARMHGLSKEEAFAAVRPYSRDHARVPLQWDDSRNAGFTAGVPWLMVNPAYRKINRKAQQEDPGSVLNYYRRLITLRKEPAYCETFVYGSFEPVFENVPGIMAYCRTSTRMKFLVAGNFQIHEQIIELPEEYREILLTNCETVECAGRTLRLSGYQVIVARL